MNDEFLYSIRTNPPPEFAARLKRKLQQQASRHAARLSIVRSLIVVFLIGGSAVAAAVLILGNRSARDSVEVSRPHPVQGVPPAAAGRTSSPSRAIETDDEAARAAIQQSPAPTQPSQRDAFTTRLAPADSGPRAAESVLAARGVLDAPTESVSRGGRTARPISILASSASYPLVKILVETLARGRFFEMPQLDTAEPADAFRDLCPDAGFAQLDIVVASRRIEAAELEVCRRTGVTRLLESKIGYQALVVTGTPAGQPIELSARKVYLALAKQVPDSFDPARLIDNPYTSWDQVDSALDARRILVLGPARDTALRRLFAALVMETGCDAHAGIRALKGVDQRRYADICHTLRTDRFYHEVEQTNTLIPQNLWAEPDALALLDYSFYEAHRAELATSALEGVEPTYATLADGTYPFARPVFVYANKARLDHLPAGVLFLSELNERAAGPSGYLSSHGLIPLDEAERLTQRERRSIPLQPHDLNPDGRMRR